MVKNQSTIWLFHAIWGLETNEFQQYELANGNTLRRIIYFHAESPVTTSVSDKGDVNIPARCHDAGTWDPGGAMRLLTV